MVCLFFFALFPWFKVATIIYIISLRFTFDSPLYFDCPLYNEVIKYIKQTFKEGNIYIHVTDSVHLNISKSQFFTQVAADNIIIKQMIK